jgi:hypothetical protein
MTVPRKLTGTFRVTERNDQTDELVRVIGTQSGIFPTTLETESIAATGNHIRVEQWIENEEQDEGTWMYL